jgi:hypothetical protein
MKTNFIIILIVLFAISVYSKEQDDGEIPNPEKNSDVVEDTLGISHNYLLDEGIRFNSFVLFASGFEDGFTGWGYYDPSVSEIVTDSDLAFSGNKVLKSVATKGVNEGGDVDYEISPAQDKIYLRFYTKFDENTVIPHHFVKIRAVKDGYWTNAGQKPPGDQAFWTGIEPLGDRTWHFYSYWHEMHSWQSYSGEPDSSRGDNPYYGNNFNVPGQTPFQKGDWICVEAMLSANKPGYHDGEQAFWINGEKIGHWKQGEPTGKWKADRFKIGTDDASPFGGYSWRTTDDVKINMIKLRWYLRNSVLQNATQAHNIVYFDNVVVAKEYIGPMYDENGPVFY